MSTNKKSNRGGFRPGSGRKKLPANQKKPRKPKVSVSLEIGFSEGFDKSNPKKSRSKFIEFLFNFWKKNKGE